MKLADLASVNAFLNGVAAVFLATGYVFIRRRNITAHRFCMASAFSASVLFLISYLVYHFFAGSVPYQGQGPARLIYFAILISHIILAIVIVPLALRTLYLALKKRFEMHRRLAKITWPLWMYVSISGVAVYVMLYW